MTDRKRASRKTGDTARMLADLSAKRKAAGVCRHCGGPVPCWSPYGDVRIGVRHRPNESDAEDA